MLNLEDFMNIRDLKQQGWSVSAIAGELHLDRKTVRKHLLDAPQPYKRENPAPCKIDPYRPFLRERWEKGVHNARKRTSPSCAAPPSGPNFTFYVILNVFSRYVLGWMVAPREGAELARKLIEETCEKQNIQPDQLGLHEIGRAHV